MYWVRISPGLTCNDSAYGGTLTMKEPMRVAIIGTSKRSDYLYGPLLRALPMDVELVSLWGRSAE